MAIQSQPNVFPCSLLSASRNLFKQGLLVWVMLQGLRVVRLESQGVVYLSEIRVCCLGLHMIPYWICDWMTGGALSSSFRHVPELR